MKQISILLLFFFVDIFTPVSQTMELNDDLPVKTGYDLSAPENIYILPSVLHEISGITETDAASIACVQDEHGFVFIYDIFKKQISRQLYFSSHGDYEGIARVDNTLYVLRSDGVLFEITDFRSGKFKSKAYITGIKGKDNEGLCYDPKNNRLLIAPKVIPVTDSKDKDKRLIYGFNLDSKKLTKDPVFEFDLKVIKRFVLDNKIKVPVKAAKKGQKGEPDIKLRISALGIHPLTYKLYVISGPEQLLLVFDMSGRIEYLEMLDRDIFIQPEGITFMKNGDMYISNEGQNRFPTLVRFRYLP